MNLKVRIFVICIGLAGLLWLVNHLNREYTVGVSFHIQYEGFNYAANQKPDSTVHAEITGSGFSLIRYYYEQPFTIALNRQDFKATKQGDSITLRVIPDNLQNTITGILPSGIRLSSIPNDTLTIKYISYPSKDVPISVLLNVSVNEGCMQSGPVKVIPHFVRISGPAERIRLIDSVFTEMLELDGLCDTVHRKVKIASIKDPMVKCNLSEIHVLVPISQFIQKDYKLHYNITYLGVIYDGDVTATLLGPPSIDEFPLELESEILENRIVFSVKNSSTAKVISISPESIPLEL